MMRMVQIGLLSVVLVAGGLMAGCADDLYGECSISPDPGEPMYECLSGNGGTQRSCVATGEIECSSGACGRYQGSDFFCTNSCDSNGDCPSGECRQFVLHQGSYCVADQFLPSNE